LAYHRWLQFNDDIFNGWHVPTKLWPWNWNCCSRDLHQTEKNFFSIACYRSYLFLTYHRCTSKLSNQLHSHYKVCHIIWTSKGLIRANPVYLNTQLILRSAVFFISCWELKIAKKEKASKKQKKFAGDVITLNIKPCSAAHKIRWFFHKL